jgi:hypothetical protein
MDPADWAAQDRMLADAARQEWLEELTAALTPLFQRRSSADWLRS